jgi:hypothetical protein
VCAADGFGDPVRADRLEDLDTVQLVWGAGTRGHTGELGLRKGAGFGPALVTRGVTHLFNLPTKIAAVCAGLITAGAVSAAALDPVPSQYV